MSKLRWLVIVLFAGIGACSDHHDKPQREDPATAAGASAISEEGRDPFGAETAAEAASMDLSGDDAGFPCPNFSLTIVGPFVQFVGETTEFSGHAQDDQRHEFQLSWSASGGELSSESGLSTKYTCSELGIHTISMTATLNAVCSSAVAHVVTCLKPAE